MSETHFFIENLVDTDASVGPVWCSSLAKKRVFIGDTLGGAHIYKVRSRSFHDINLFTFLFYLHCRRLRTKLPNRSLNCTPTLMKPSQLILREPSACSHARKQSMSSTFQMWATLLPPESIVLCCQSHIWSTPHAIISCTLCFF